MDQPEQSYSSGFFRPLAAWGVSLIVHLLVMIVGLLLIRPLVQVGGETARPVGIVLATRTTSADGVEYFEEEAARAEAGKESVALATANAGTAGLPASASLPATSLNIALPGKHASAVEGVELSKADVTGTRTGKTALDSSALTAEILAEEAKRPRVKGPEGEQGEVSIFGSGTTRGHSFVFLIDRSQSMGSQGLGAIAAAEVELLAALEKLESNHKFQVIAYNQAPTYFQERKLIAVSEESRRTCREFLDSLAAFGATNHERALISALHQLHPDVLYLLTDGDPVLTPGQRKRIAEQAKGARICCIHFGRVRPDDEAAAGLKALAHENGGSYVFVDVNKR